MPRTFNGSSDILAMGNPASLNGSFPMTVAVLVFATTLGSASALLSRSVTATAGGWSLEFNFSTGKLKFRTSSGGSANAATVAVTANKWMVVGAYVTSSNVHFFTYDYASDTFATEDVSNTQNVGAGVCDNFHIGDILDSSTEQRRFTGDIEVAAVWKGSSPTNDQLHNLAFDLSAWYEFDNPVSLWILDQSDVTQKIVDEEGIANESSRTGTTISTRSCSLWNYGVGPINQFSIATTNTYTDTNTPASKTTPSSTDVSSFIEATVAVNITTPSAVELESSSSSDSGTVASVTQPSSADSVVYVEAATIASVTQISAVEIAPSGSAIDNATLSTITHITNGEYSFTHPTGYWGIFDTDNGFI